MKEIFLLIFFIISGALFFLLPDFFNIDRDYLCSTGWAARTYAETLFSGQYYKLIETPRPLWDLFWLLVKRPSTLYFSLSLLFGTLGVAFLLLSREIFSSFIPGLLSFLIVLLSYHDFLGPFLLGAWTLPYLTLIFLAIFFYIKARIGLFSLSIFLSGLIRPESWWLAVYFLGFKVADKEFRPIYLLPLLAPVLWLLYDLRIAGDLFYSYKVTRDWAYYTALLPTDFIQFWRRIAEDFKDKVGLPILILAIIGIYFRVKKKKPREVFSDPLLIFIFIPLLFTWLYTLKEDIFLMGRFFPVTLSLIPFLAFFISKVALGLVPNNSFKATKERDKRKFLIVSTLLLLIQIPRIPSVIRETHKGLKSEFERLAALEETANELKGLNLNKYEYILIPLRRYGIFYQILGAEHKKFISYREVSLKIIFEGGALADYFPLLCVWIRGDEPLYAPFFANLDKGETVDLKSLGITLKLKYKTSNGIGFIYEILIL